MPALPGSESFGMLFERTKKKFFFLSAGMETRALHMLGQHYTTEPHPPALMLVPGRADSLVAESESFDGVHEYFIFILINLPK